MIGNFPPRCDDCPGVGLNLNIPLPGPVSYSTRLGGGRGSRGGCLGLFVAFAVVTYAFTYWQVTLVILGVVALLAGVYVLGLREQRKQERQRELEERHAELDALMSSVTTLPIPVQQPPRR